VRVVVDPGRGGARHEERHHLPAEVRGEHESGVVLLRLGAPDRLLRAREHPVQVGVGAQRRQDLVPDVDPHGQEAALVPLVRVGHRDLEVLRVAERVPAREHVEPREERGDDDDPEEHDERDRAPRRLPQVVAEEPGDVVHDRFPWSWSSARGVSDRVARSSRASACRRERSGMSSTFPAKTMFCRTYSIVTTVPITRRHTTPHRPRTVALASGTNQATPRSTTLTPTPIRTARRITVRWRFMNHSARRAVFSRNRCRSLSAWTIWLSRRREPKICTSSLTKSPVSASLTLN